MSTGSSGFWAKLKKPIMAMAPMANVTDAAFRRMFAEVAANGGKGPDIFWTEFVSVEGLLSAGRDQLLVDLWYGDGKDGVPAERPMVVQIFGDKPEQFEEVAKLIRELGFDGVDINMGCPDSGVEKSGAGAALIKDPARAKEIIRATKRGATGADGKTLPVSVKTRLGYRSLDEMTPWLGALLEEDLAALIVHLRTRKEMSDVPARWEVMPEIIALRNRIAPGTLLLANGDVASLADAKARVAATPGLDGIMIGRGMFGNPWFFNEGTGGEAPNLGEKLMCMVRHTELFEKLYKSNVPRPARDAATGERPLKNFDVMKKHFKAYCSGFDGAKELRIKLMEAENATEVRKILEKYFADNALPAGPMA